MSSYTYDVGYPQERNRMTVAFRIILAIPHLIVSQVWGYLAQVLAVVQWVIVLFTGKRNEGIWNLQQSWLGYYSRVIGYVDLLFDQYPAFGTEAGPVPVPSHDLVRGAGQSAHQRAAHHLDDSCSDRGRRHGSRRCRGAAGLVVRDPHHRQAVTRLVGTSS